MSKLNFSKGKLSKFISSKGFYVAVAVCLVGAGTATWLAVDRTISGIENSNSRVIAEEGALLENPLVEEVEQKQPDVPRPSASSSSSSTSSSSSVAPSTSSVEPEEVSAPSEEPASSQTPPSLVYSLPIRGTIINPFSNGELVKNVTLNDWRTHDGIDIAGEKGADIYAAADGVVEKIQQDSLWGTIVTISHADGITSVYYGLDSNLSVKEGDAVLVKQVIGKLDSIPSEIELENHLHFAMKRDGAWIDPMSILAQTD